jgi:diacylglycerol kinase (ATP)
MGIPRVMIIWNPASGRGRNEKYVQQIEKIARKIGIEPRVEKTDKSDGNTAFNLGREAARLGYGYLAVVAGDGTDNEAANGMMNSGVLPEKFPILIIFRNGTGNDIANGLRIKRLKNSRDIENIFRLISLGEASIKEKIVWIDLGKVSWEEGSRYFINVFSAVLCARINKLAVDYKRGFRRISFLPRFGDIVYLLAALWTLFSMLFSRRDSQFPEVEVGTLDICLSSFKTVLVAIANGPKYGGMFRIAPRAKMDSGQLEICHIKKMVWPKMLWNIFRVLKGTHLSLPEVATLPNGELPKASSFVISSKEKLPAQMDGEILPARKRYEISIFPRTLKVLVP